MPLPAASPAPRPAIVIEGVRFEAAAAERALQWLNTADEAAFEAAGIYRRGISCILSARPFPDLEAFAQTRGSGAWTVGAGARANE